MNPTKDIYDKLTNTELDLLVATKLLGFKRYHWVAGVQTNFYWYQHPNELLDEIEHRTVEIVPDSKLVDFEMFADGFRYIEKYTRDNHLAFDLLEKVRQKGYTVGIYSRHESPETWIVGVRQGAGSMPPAPHELTSSDSYGYGSLAQAACKALLRAHDKEPFSLDFVRTYSPSPKNPRVKEIT